MINKFSVIVLAALVSAGAAFAAQGDYNWSLTGEFGGPGQEGALYIAVQNDVAFGSAALEVVFNSEKVAILDSTSSSKNLVPIDRTVGKTNISAFPGGNTSAFRISFIAISGDIAAGSGNIWSIKYRTRASATVGDTVHFSLVDSEKRTVFAEYVLTIPEAAVGPEFNSLPLQVANEGEELAFTLTVTDPDLTDLIYRMLISPGTGAELDSTTGEFTWTTDVTGTYDADFYVTDGTLGDSLTVQIKINGVPEFTEMDVVKVNEGSQVEFTLEATDSDQDILVYKQLDSVVSGAELDSLTGEFVWPAGAAAGSYDAKFSVSDGYGVDTVVVTIDINSLPVLVETGDQQGMTDIPLELVLQVNDSDLNDTHVFHLLSAPAGMRIDSLGGIINWTPAEVGDFTAKVEVTDGMGADTLDILFTIEQGPLALVINSPVEGASFEVASGDSLKVPFDVTNAGQELTRSDLTLPTGVVFVSDLNLVWVPTEAAAGQNQFKIAFTNETGVADTVSFSVMVTVKDKPPVWARFDTVRVQQDQQVSQVFTAPQDEDPSTVIVLARNLPTGASFDSDNLTFTWKPAFDQEGLYQFSLLAIDINGQRSTRVVNVVVSKTNRAPTIVYDEDSFVGQDDIAIGFGVVATDPDDDELTITWSGVPAGALTSGAELFWLNPVEGEYEVVATATDPGGLEASVTIPISIEGINDPPVFAKLVNPSVDAGQPLSFNVVATDPDGDELLVQIVRTGANGVIDRGAEFDGSTFTWTPQASDIGQNIVTFRATDPEGLRVRMEVHITVTGRNIKLPPQFDTDFFEQAVQMVAGQQNVIELPVTNEDTEGFYFWANNVPEDAVFDAENGTIVWTPQLGDNGIHQVDVGVSNSNFIDKETLVINVIVNSVDVVVEGNSNWDYKSDMMITKTGMRILGSFPGSILTIDEVTGQPAFVQMLEFNGAIRMVPPATVATGIAAGDYPITVRGTDELFGVGFEKQVNLHVSLINSAPVLGDVADISVGLGDPVEFTLTATDVDSEDELTFSSPALPAGASLDPQSGAFSWTAGTAGVTAVEFMVSDGHDQNSSDGTTVRILVGDGVNNPPQMDQIADLKVNAGSTMGFEVSASDTEPGDEITLVLNNAPSFVSLEQTATNPAVGTLALSPAFNQSGTYTFQVGAQGEVDGNQFVDWEDVTVAVKFVDQLPAFSGLLDSSLPIVRVEGQVNEGETWTGEIKARPSLDGDPVIFTYGTTNGVNIEVVDSLTRRVTYSPDYSSVEMGETGRVDVKLSDGRTTVTKSLRIYPVNVNRPPRIFNIEDQSVAEGDIITFEINAFDPDGDSTDVFTAGYVTYLTEGNPPAAGIRDGRVFFFDTALLPVDQPINCAFFSFWAVDEFGAVSDTVVVEIKVVRTEEDDVTQGTGKAFPGLGLGFQMNGQFSGSLPGKFTSISGFFEHGNPGVLLAGAGKEKEAELPKGAYAYLAGDLTSKFYSIRRGWGLDLTADGSQAVPEGVTAEMTLNYFDEDLPTDVPNFSEDRLAVFGFDASQNIWVRMTDAVVDTEANSATFTVNDFNIVDYTVGAVLDVVAPVVSNVKVEAGAFSLNVTQVDTTYSLEGPYVFKLNITDDEIVSETNAGFFYSINGVAFTEGTLTRSQGNLFTAQVEGPLTDGSSIRYYFVASDNMNSVTSPVDAPTDFYELVLVERTFIPGDVTGDSSINIFDLLELLSVLSGSSDMSPSSDVNQDGSTNVFDLLSLLGMLAE